MRKKRCAPSSKLVFIGHHTYVCDGRVGGFESNGQKDGQAKGRSSASLPPFRQGMQRGSGKQRIYLQWPNDIK